jgi:glycosyltransferase involved in cell wall biosynthesis
VRVLGFGTYNSTTRPRARIILDGLRARGDDVIEVNEPLGFSTAERVEMLGNPRLAFRLIPRILARWMRLIWRSRHARRGGGFDAVFVGYLGHFDVVLARILFPRTCVVLDLLVFAGDTGRDRGVSSSPKLYLLDLLDRVAIRCANVIVVDTDEHRALLPPPIRHRAVVVPVGAPAEWFAQASRPVRRSDNGLHVAFFGLYTPLQGTTVIGATLAELADRPDITVTMIGYGQDHDATRELARDNPNVTWLDWVEYADLPAFVAGHDVCLGIFGATPKAFRVVPNKVYQGAAAGCAIVTSDTPPQRRALGEHAQYVPPGDSAALAKALRALADDSDELARLSAQGRATALEFFTPNAIVEPLREHLAGRNRGVE